MSDYQPETDTSPKLKSERVTQYQEMSGVLRWAVDLGRVGILLETARMSMYLAFHFRGHLKQVLNVSGYLKSNPKRNVFFYPQHLTIDECLFSAHNWYNF